MLRLSKDTRFLDWKINNTQYHIEQMIARLPFEPFYKTKRMVCSLGKSYPYSGQVAIGHSFDLYPPLKILMEKLNAELKTNYNSVLINWYPINTVVGIGAHSDAESALVRGQPIASISLGAPCKFILQSKDQFELVEVELKDSDVFIMGVDCQRHYTHKIPYSRMESHRISLTFREFK